MGFRASNPLSNAVNGATSAGVRFSEPSETTAAIQTVTVSNYTDRIIKDAFAILDGGGTLADAKSAVNNGRGDLAV